MSLFPIGTTPFRVEEHTRPEPYEPMVRKVLAVVDGSLSTISRSGTRDGGVGGMVTLNAVASLSGHVTVEQGYVLVDVDGIEWTIDAASRRTALGTRRTVCNVSRTVGAVTS